MSDPFIGEVRIFAGTFAPRNWAFCDGQKIGISQNEELASLLGSMYGGDGRTYFKVPDMRGRVPVHKGIASEGGKIGWQMGMMYGYESVRLILDNLPYHTHTVKAMKTLADSSNPVEKVLAKTDSALPLYNNGENSYTNVDMNSLAVSNSGADKSHYNMMPYLAMNFIIALKGQYPPRN